MGQTSYQLEITEEINTSRFYCLLQEAKTICFVGDSLTEGTINGGVPWYEPLLPYIGGKIFNFSQGGATTEILLAYFLSSIVHTAADLFVVAAGANDILFRDPMFCAMTAKDYVLNLQKLRRSVCNCRPDAKFVFIAPWIAMDGDASIIGGTKPLDTEEAYRHYTQALKAWCEASGDVFIDANAYLARQFASQPQDAYLLDFIHPNAGAGVQLYAKAVLMYGCAQMK